MNFTQYNIIKALLVSLQLAMFVLAQNKSYKSQESSDIFILKSNQNSMQTTNSWNKTYLIEGDQPFDSSITNFIFELEIETPLDINNLILFGLKKTKALYYNDTLDTFNAELIDTRGYYMQKQYYRLDLKIDEVIREDDKYYITIYQNTLQPQELNYSLRMIILKSNQAEKLIPCPFNCLEQGYCNRREGHCYCNYGFVDFDCSKPSSNLQSANNQANLELQILTKQQIDFDLEGKKNGKFYHLLEQSLSGYLYLSLDLAETQKQNLSNQNSQFSQKFLEIYYTPETKSLKGIGVADRNFAKLSQVVSIENLINSPSGIEIYLDEFHSSAEKLSPHELQNIENIILLFGFRLSDGQSSKEQNSNIAFEDLKFNFQIILREQPTNMVSQSSSLMNLIKNNEQITLLFVLLLLLILVLVGLLIFIRKNTQIIEQTQQQRITSQLNKKLQKELEFKKIFDMILSFPFNEENKYKFWPHLKQYKGVSEKQIQNVEQPSCSICLCEFEESEEVRVTYCSHFFHSDCLREWLKKQKNCPNCRNDLTEASLQSKSKSPSTILKQIFRSYKPSPQIQKQQTKGYEQQVDEINLNVLSSAAQQGPKTLENQTLPKETKHNTTQQRLRTSESVQSKRDSLKKNNQDIEKGQKPISQTSLNENENIERDSMATSVQIKSRKLLKLNSLETPSPMGIQQYNLFRDKQDLETSIFKSQKQDN